MEQQKTAPLCLQKLISLPAIVLQGNKSKVKGQADHETTDSEKGVKGINIFFPLVGNSEHC